MHVHTHSFRLSQDEVPTVPRKCSTDPYHCAIVLTTSPTWDLLLRNVYTSKSHSSFHLSLFFSPSRSQKGRPSMPAHPIFICTIYMNTARRQLACDSEHMSLLPFCRSTSSRSHPNGSFQQNSPGSPAQPSPLPGAPQCQRQSSQGAGRRRKPWGKGRSSE